VFVSSTLDELAGERGAARDAIERLRLTPVLFELGARPHPPQDVYRGYLDRSDIFVGIYGESYGWIGPGMDVSGLEDEYLRSAGKPRLLYVKRPAPAREPRLEAFLDRLRTDATASYKLFRDPTELRDLVENDLALLLTERFASTASDNSRREPRTRLPAMVDAFVGRQSELETLRELLKGAARLITVTGPGGVGKSRLALEAARETIELFSDGVEFVALSSVSEPELVTSVVLTSLDLPAGPNVPVTGSLIDHLRESELLLLLDNFEHVLEAAGEIGSLLAACPRLRVLVTSRSVLRLRGEREFALAPLPVPEGVRLFSERARAFASGFELTETTAAPVEEICRRLDGLPLAIELAAARVRTLPPESMLPLLERRLDFLTVGGRDYAERHRTLQATIDWSFRLLERSEQRLLEQASVFRGGWDLTAASTVCGEGTPVLTDLESLLEKSLVRREVVSNEPRFTMLETIREYAGAALETEGNALGTQRRHAAFYLGLVFASGERLRSSAQAASLERLELENDNIRTALRWSLEHAEPDRVAAAGWELMPFWWLRGLFEEGGLWMQEALESGGVTDVGRANALLVAGYLAFWRADYRTAIPTLSEAFQTFASGGDKHRAALASLPLGAARAAAGDSSALAMLEESRGELAKSGDEWGLMFALNGLCWALNVLDMQAPLELFEEARARANDVGTKAELATALGNLSRRKLLRGERGEAKRLLAEALDIVRTLRSPTGVALYVEMAADMASREGDHLLAVRLFAASAALRTETEADAPPPVARLREGALTAARAALGEDAVEEARANGAYLEAYETADEAVAWLAGRPR